MAVAVLLTVLLASASALAEEVTPGAPALEGSPSALVDDARAAMAAGRFEEAARLYGALADAGGGAEASVLEGLAWVEAGAPRRAIEALSGLGDPDALNLLGMALIDVGRQREGVEALERARSSGDAPAAARASLNLALVRLDQGRLDEAVALIEQAERGAAADAALARACAEARAAVASTRGGAASPGPRARLDQALARGDRDAATQAIAELEATAVGQKQQVEVLIARGAALRASGAPDEAVAVLSEALARARAAGLARETAEALAGLGVAHGLAGRQDLALTLLAEARETAESAGFLTAAVDHGAEAALMALRLGSVDAAAERLEALRRSLASMEHPEGQARVDELAGGVAAARGDLDAARLAYERALRVHEARGHHAEAARVAVGLMAAVAERDAAAAEAPRARALAAFARAGDPLGPAHVALAWGLARARARDLDGALAAFGEARDLATALPGRHAAFVATTAELNAARALVALGASEDAARVAAARGIEGAVAHHQSLADAMAAYERGLAAYDAGRFSEARRHFAEAADVFERAGEAAYARQARHALAWSAYNLAVGLPVAEAHPFWGELIAEAQRLDDPELEARAVAAAALSARELGLAADGAALEAAARLASERGLPEVGARCHAALAEGPGGLDERARNARRAMALGPGLSVAVYAAYSVAVDAFNAGEYTLAADLAREALPEGGELAPSLQEVLDASMAAGQAP